MVIRIVKYVIHIPGCHGNICKRKVVYELAEDGQLIKNGELLPYKVLGAYNWSVYSGPGGETRDLESYGIISFDYSKLKKEIEIGDQILLERTDNEVPNRKYILTWEVAEIWKE